MLKNIGALFAQAVAWVKKETSVSSVTAEFHGIVAKLKDVEKRATAEAKRLTVEIEERAHLVSKHGDEAEAARRVAAKVGELVS